MLCCEPHVAPGSYIYRHSPSPGAREGLLYLCYTGSYVYEPGYDLVREDFDCYLLEVVLEGSITFEAEGAVHTARQDDVVLIDCHKPHRYYTNTGCRVLWVHFDGAPADTYYQWILRMHGNVFPMRNVRKVAGSLENIYQMFHRDLGVNEARVALELTQALSAMLEAPAPAPGTEHSASIERIAAYINAHPELPLSVAELAGMAALSEYHFIRIFKAATGMTPGQYIITARLDYARYLLKTTSLPIQQISNRVGYPSESLFCKAFKKQLGLTPTAYRGKRQQDLTNISQE